MPKYYGKIGYRESVETRPGVWEDVVKEVTVSGDVLRNMRKLQSAEGLNDNITVSNSLSIVAHAELNDHIFDLLYATWMGAYWKVTNVEVQPPRLLLTLGMGGGGLYNGTKAGASDDSGDTAG